MAFADEVVKAGRGVAYYLDLSLDGFATVAFRYATHAGRFDGSHDYEARIRSMGSLARSLGHGVTAAGSVDVLLDNTDEQADWVMDAVNAYALRASVRLYVAIY